MTRQPVPEPAAHCRFAAIAESTEAAIVAKDLNGIVTAWNPGAARMFGYAAEDIIGASITAIIPPERLHEEVEILALVRSGGSASNFLTQRQRREGVVLDVMLTISPIRDDAGNIVGVSKIARDVTEAQRVKGELTRREALLSAIFNTAPDSLVVIDESGIIQSFNPAAARMFGYGVEEAIGQNVNILMGEPFRSSHDGYLKRYLTTGNAKIIGIGRITSGRGKSGRVFPLELQVGEVMLPGGRRLFAGFMRDLTDREERERRIGDLQAELFHVSRVNELGQMASALAHELNQPLTAIANYLAGSRRLNERGRSEEVAQALAAMTQQVDRAQQIIQRIRDHVQRRGTEKRFERISTLIEEAIALSGAASDQALELAIDIAPDIEDVWVDKVQVQQVLLNLIRNAMEAMRAMATRRLFIRALPVDDMVEIQIRDDGPGLPEVVKAKLFQPFVTTKTNGMGVGLSLCRTIIEAQGGRLTAESEPGNGTIFRFTLPIAPPSARLMTE
jgi:two-component system sensor kinase FixL